jgi:hypothetical protein
MGGTMIADGLAALMRQGWFAGILAPLLIAGAVALWKAASRPSGWQPEDKSIGFDLMFAAFGSELALLPTMPQSSVALQVADRILIALPVILFFTAAGMWAIGYARTASGAWEPRRWAVALGNVLGLILLAAVYASTLDPATADIVLDWVFR